jgi:hypothetical protein
MPPAPAARRSQFRLAHDASCHRWRGPACHVGCHKGPVLLPYRSLQSGESEGHGILASLRAYESATSDEQAALRVWMRSIILPGDARRLDMDRVRRSEKASIQARAQRIVEFPRTCGLICPYACGGGNRFLSAFWFLRLLGRGPSYRPAPASVPYSKGPAQSAADKQKSESFISFNSFRIRPTAW